MYREIINEASTLLKELENAEKEMKKLNEADGNLGFYKAHLFLDCSESAVLERTIFTKEVDVKKVIEDRKTELSEKIEELDRRLKEMIPGHVRYGEDIVYTRVGEQNIKVYWKIGGVDLLHPNSIADIGRAFIFRYKDDWTTVVGKDEILDIKVINRCGDLVRTINI